MLLLIKNVLDTRQLNEVQGMLNAGEFIDGRLSAGREAEVVKHNQELSPQSPLQRRLNAVVMGSLVQNSQYQQAVLPAKVATAFYVRYQVGMNYGYHVDDPVMGPMQGRYRSDISTTVFLNDATEYEGGELLIHTPFGEQSVKGNAGDAVIYPASSWHKVAEVTSGTRWVAVTWAQSLVRDSQQRELLYQLSQARDSMLDKLPQANETAQMSTVYANLLRMWAEV